MIFGATVVTKQGAIDTATGMVERFGKAMVIYRLAAWPPEVYSVIAEDRGLPKEADVFATITPDGVRPVVGQGSLF